MSKLLYHEQAREAIRRGVGQLARTVRSTLGPCGHTVMLANSFGPPTVNWVEGMQFDKALQNAATVSTLLLTSDVLITNTK